LKLKNDKIQKEEALEAYHALKDEVEFFET
jgi:hypothetical protein